MKRLIILILTVCSLYAGAQPVTTQGMGTPKTLVKSNGYLSADSGIVVKPVFADTASAKLGGIDLVAGVLIRVADQIWMRSADLSKWILVGSGVSGGGGGDGISQLGNSGNLWLTRVNDSTYAIDTATVNTFYRATFVRSGISYVNPSWITSLPWSKITGTPTTLSGYGITDATGVSRFLDSLTAHTSRFNAVTASLATKLNISDTANMRPRLYAGSNVTITGTYPNLTISSAGGSSSPDTSTLIIDTTYTPLAEVISADTLRLRSMRVNFNGVEKPFTETDSTLLLELQAIVAGDTASMLTNYIRSQRFADSLTAHTTRFNGVTSSLALKLNLSDTASMLTNYIRRQELKDTASAIRSAIGSGGGGGVPSGNYGNILLLRNGALATPGTDSLDFDAGLVYKGNLTGSNFYYAGASLYPYMTLSGNDPLIYFGGTGAAYPSLGRSSGILTLNGSNTAKRVNINSYLSGPVMASFYDNGTSRSATFLKTSIYVDTIIGGASDGSIMGNAYIGDSTSTGTGNSGHMFRAIARQGYNAASLNTFYSTVKMGNNNAAATQGHSVSFQHDAFKFGANTQDISYGAAFLADLIYGGIVNKRYGLAYWDANVNTGGGAKLGFQSTIKIEKLKAAIGLNAHILADSSDYAQLDGNMYLGDSLHASGARKAFHWFNGTAPSSNISGAIVWAEGGELKARDGGGNVTILTDAPGTSYNSEPVATFTAGAGFAADTVVFTDSTLYGSFYTDQDSFYITRVIVVMKGQSGDTLGIQIVHNDSINVTGTTVNGGTIAVNSRTTGNITDVSTNQGIPPNSWVWVKSPTVIAGKKPEYLSITLVGYKKYQAP